MELLKDGAHLYWMNLRKDLDSHLSVLSDAKAIEGQREQFSYITELIVKAIKAFGIANSIYYLQHCPMAFDDQGANWLSKEEQILNPYFGHKMLKCGIVKDNFK